MRYFKKKDGLIIGKIDSVKKSQVDEYLKDGAVECDENGIPLKPVKKSAKKKSED
jgi:hypothetical protein